MPGGKAIPFRIIALDDEGYHLVIRGEVNGHDCNLILDTGASKSAFDKNFISGILNGEELVKAEKLSSGLGTNEMEIHELKLRSLSIHDFKLVDFDIAVLDLSHVNFAYEQLKLPAVNGIIGNDILVRYHAMIDYRNSQLWLDAE